MNNNGITSVFFCFNLPYYITVLVTVVYCRVPRAGTRVRSRPRPLLINNIIVITHTARFSEVQCSTVVCEVLILLSTLVEHTRVVAVKTKR